MKLSDSLTVAGLVLVAFAFGLAYLPLGIGFSGIALVLIGVGLSGEKKASVDR